MVFNSAFKGLNGK